MGSKKEEQQSPDRRLAARKLTETRVQIHHSAFSQAPLRTKDMSAGGVFVSTPNPVRLSVGTPLEITFMIDLGNITKLRKLSAKVVDATESGIRLSFESS